jgi:hypothetical protein
MPRQAPHQEARTSLPRALQSSASLRAEPHAGLGGVAGRCAPGALRSPDAPRPRALCDEKGALR